MNVIHDRLVAFIVDSRGRSTEPTCTAIYSTLASSAGWSPLRLVHRLKPAVPVETTRAGPPTSSPRATLTMERQRRGGRTGRPCGRRVAGQGINKPPCSRGEYRRSNGEGGPGHRGPAPRQLHLVARAVPSDAAGSTSASVFQPGGRRLSKAWFKGTSGGEDVGPLRDAVGGIETTLPTVLAQELVEQPSGSGTSLD